MRGYGSKKCDKKAFKAELSALEIKILAFKPMEFVEVNWMNVAGKKSGNEDRKN